MKNSDRFSQIFPFVKFKEIFCCYSLMIDGRTAFIGCDKLERITEIPSAANNSEWQRIATDLAPVAIEIWYYGPEADARALAGIETALQKPWCNVNGTDLGPPVASRYKFTMVENIETGERYENAAEAARSISASASNMSAHLNGKPGFATIKGARFRRV